MVEEWCSGYFINWDKKVYTLLLAAMSVTKFIVCTEYKEHILIREVWTSTASLHDNQIDLSAPGQTIYRDKGYFGVKPNASMDKTMHRASRNHPLSCKEKRRNKLTSFASFSDWFSSITSHVVNYRRWMIKNWGFFAILLGSLTWKIIDLKNSLILYCVNQALFKNFRKSKWVLIYTF